MSLTPAQEAVLEQVAKGLDDAAAGLTAAAAAVRALIGPTPPPEPVDPTVILVAVPASVVQGQPVVVSATVTVDPSLSVQSVAFMVDGVAAASDTQAPWTWTTSGLAVGIHQLTARVTDSAGQQATSAPVVVTVTPQQPPQPAVVTLTQPPAGPLASQPFLFAATVQEAPGAATATVDYLADGQPAADQDVPPAPYVKQSTRTLVPGAHSLQARQTDRAGKVTLSAPVSVTVPSTPVPPPIGKLAVVKAAGSVPSQLQLSGKRFIVVGTNDYAVNAYSSNGQMSAVNGWEQSQADANAAHLAGLGVNWRRIPVSQRTDAQQVAALRTIVNANAAKGIYSMLVAFDSGSAPSAAAGQLLVNLWSQLGKPDSVILNTVNEPHLISAQQWIDGSKAEIAAIRAGGYGAPIVVGCQNWCWTLDPPSARQILAADPSGQLVFESHRYAFDGSSIRGSGDAAVWANEWSQATDLCKIVGEYGWFNGGGASSSIQTWCVPMANAIVAGAKAGWLSGALSWMFLWDQNSHIVATAPPPGEPTSSNRDWYAISKGAPWTYNEWGTVAKSCWQQLAALNAGVV